MAGSPFFRSVFSTCVTEKGAQLHIQTECMLIDKVPCRSPVSCRTDCTTLSRLDDLTLLHQCLSGRYNLSWKRHYLSIATAPEQHTAWRQKLCRIGCPFQQRILPHPRLHRSSIFGSLFDGLDCSSRQRTLYRQTLRLCSLASAMGLGKHIFVSPRFGWLSY